MSHLPHCTWSMVVNALLLGVALGVALAYTVTYRRMAKDVPERRERVE